MQRFTDRTNPEIAQLLKNGGIGIVLTDTLYGIVASAWDQAAVERLYRVRGRSSDKPSIVLIDSIEQAWEDYRAYEKVLESAWPGKVSIILPATARTPMYIHRGAHSVAYRMPDDPELRSLLRQTGPIIAPSANSDGMPPAMNIKEAEGYFGDSVDFYVDSGQCKVTEPSKIIRLSPDGQSTIIRGKADDSRRPYNHTQTKKI